MEQEAKEAKNEYYRAYRKNNPQKIKRINAKYWKKKATKEKEADK